MTEFETWEAAFLSGQIPENDFLNLLVENVDFSIWYEERAAARHAND